MVDSQYCMPNSIGISALDCVEAFRLLSPQEKLYAHYLSRAAWYGGLTVLLQTSPESANIFVLLQRIFRKQTPAQLEQVATAAGLSEHEYKAFLVYAAGVYTNMGNYKSFGDTKFVPKLPKDQMEAVVKGSQAFQEQPAEMETLWDSCSYLIYSLEDKQKQLGLGDKGITTYFSGNCCMEDAELAQKFLNSKKLSAYNTRLFKKDNGAKSCYEVRLASAVKKDCAVDGECESCCGTFSFEDKEFIVKRGDYAPIMERVCFYLEKAQAYSANENQRRMIEEYRRSFTIGSVEAHKEGSRFWIKDKGPIVESYIGFIESYRDPFGSRGEFEGFVAIVNKAMSERFAKLVSSAEVLLLELPWPREFEKDKFLKPDFTSLDILTFAGSGIPAGINIPNYDDIRQSEGFKNVSLGLEFYTLESKTWRQAHMQARFVILQVLLEAGEGLVSLVEVTGEDGKPSAHITIDRSKIHTVGKLAIHRFLCKLQVMKSTGNVEGGRALYDKYSTVSDSGAHNFLRLRETVLLRKEARKMFVQANTRVKGENVELLEYEGSVSGLIQSFTERFQEDCEQMDLDLLELSRADYCCWCS